jgi:hypothetical protein
MRDFLTDKDHRRMVFIKGSVHQNHIDAPFIFKSVTIKKIMGKRGVYNLLGYRYTLRFTSSDPCRVS